MTDQHLQQMKAAEIVSLMSDLELAVHLQAIQQIEKLEIARLTAKVEQLRTFIRTYTAIECRGQTYYPEWAERALRE